MTPELEAHARLIAGIEALGYKPTGKPLQWQRGRRTITLKHCTRGWYWDGLPTRRRRRI